MLTRIVKMEFLPEVVDEFLANFELVKNRIQHFEGCFGVQLLRDKNSEATFFTISLWESENHLNAYRSSDLFKNTWAKTKVGFADKPEAWSVFSVDG